MEGNGICSAAFCASAALRGKLLLGASGLNPLRLCFANPPPPKGGGFALLTGSCQKAPPSGELARERLRGFSRPLGEGGCDQREQTEGVISLVTLPYITVKHPLKNVNIH